jgi:hypothetical protein
MGGPLQQPSCNQSSMQSIEGATQSSMQSIEGATQSFMQSIEDWVARYGRAINPFIWQSHKTYKKAYWVAP